MTIRMRTTWCPIMDKLQRLYKLYLSAYRKEIRKQQEQLDAHLKAKFIRENKLMWDFLASPTPANWYRVANGIYGPNDGNRYSQVRELLDKGEIVLRQLGP